MILESLFGPVKRLSPNPLDSYWYEPVGAKTVAGVKVTEDVALTFSACWAATVLLSCSGSMLPLNLMRRRGGGSQIADDDPRHWLVNSSPNPDSTPMAYRMSRMGQQINWGNGISEIGRNGAGIAAALYPIHAARVPPQTNIKRGPDGKLRYIVNNNDGSKTTLNADDVLHFPSVYSDDGIVGKGVVTQARLSISLGIATEKQGAAYFGNGARPLLVIKNAKFDDKRAKEDREEFRRQWQETHGGPENNAKPALLPFGADITALSFNAEDSQFLETRQFSIEDIARWYGVPPHMIQNLLRATNNNIEQMSLEFVKYSLMRWLVLIEQELNKKLLSPEERKTMYFRHDTDELERADIKTRTEAYQSQMFNGALSLNDWMAKEHRNPIGPVGDLHWVQQAMIPVEMAAKGPQNPEPPAAPPAAQKPDGDETPGENPNAKDGENELAVSIERMQNSQRQIAAAMLRDVMSRMISLEVNAVKRVAEKPSRFDARLREFYDKHKLTMLRALAEPINVYRAAGGDLPKDMIDQHIAESLRRLDALCDCQADELSIKVDECVGAWHEERLLMSDSTPLAPHETLAIAINNGMAMLAEKLDAEKPPPTIIVNVPQQPPPEVRVENAISIPPQEPVVVNVPQPIVNVAPPVVNVAAPNVSVQPQVEVINEPPPAYDIEVTDNGRGKKRYSRVPSRG